MSERDSDPSPSLCALHVDSRNARCLIQAHLDPAPHRSRVRHFVSACVDYVEEYLEKNKYLDSAVSRDPSCRRICRSHCPEETGDRLTGAIMKSDGKDIVIKSEIAGEVTVPLNSVRKSSRPPHYMCS